MLITDQVATAPCTDRVQESFPTFEAKLYATLLLVVFLVGLVAMWLASRTYARERDAAQASLQISG